MNAECFIQTAIFILNLTVSVVNNDLFSLILLLAYNAGTINQLFRRLYITFITLAEIF